MGFRLKNVVPWGRSFDEYVAMFSLSDVDLQKRILGCGDGPASFNAGLTMQGGRISSVDPLYRFSLQQVRRRIKETYPDIMEQMRKNREEFVWTTINSVDELGRIRIAAMDKFLSDYQAGLKQGRYINCELPYLPFNDRKFDLAVCSHLLFLYSEQYSGDFHFTCIRELCRVAAEVRIFPLLELGSKISRHLQGVADRLCAIGYFVSIESVAYEFQRGGNQMMKIHG